ncbi:MAG: hypothetical protein ABIC68_02920 [Candidatus Omnitrophota bacterium]
MIVEKDMRNDIFELEKRRSDLRRMLKDCICVPVVLRDYERINLITNELNVLREKNRELKER